MTRLIRFIAGKLVGAGLLLTTRKTLEEAFYIYFFYVTRAVQHCLLTSCFIARIINGHLHAI